MALPEAPASASHRLAVMYKEVGDLLDTLKAVQEPLTEELQRTLPGYCQVIRCNLFTQGQVGKPSAYPQASQAVARQDAATSTTAAQAAPAPAAAASQGEVHNGANAPEAMVLPSQTPPSRCQQTTC